MVGKYTPKCEICGKYVFSRQTTHEDCVTKKYAQDMKVPVIMTHEGFNLRQNLSKDEIWHCERYVDQTAAKEFNEKLGLKA